MREKFRIYISLSLNLISSLILLGCLKEPKVEEQSTDAVSAVNLLDRDKTDESAMLKHLSRIEAEPQAGFDWKFFWQQAKEKKLFDLHANQLSDSITHLMTKSCQTQHLSSALGLAQQLYIKTENSKFLSPFFAETRSCQAPLTAEASHELLGTLAQSPKVWPNMISWLHLETRLSSSYPWAQWIENQLTTAGLEKVLRRLVNDEDSQRLSQFLNVSDRIQLKLDWATPVLKESIVKMKAVPWGTLVQGELNNLPWKAAWNALHDENLTSQQVNFSNGIAGLSCKPEHFDAFVNFLVKFDSTPLLVKGTRACEQAISSEVFKSALYSSMKMQKSGSTALIYLSEMEVDRGFLHSWLELDRTLSSQQWRNEFKGLIQDRAFQALEDLIARQPRIAASHQNPALALTELVKMDLTHELKKTPIESLELDWVFFWQNFTPGPLSKASVQYLTMIEDHHCTISARPFSTAVLSRYPDGANWLIAGSTKCQLPLPPETVKILINSLGKKLNGSDNKTELMKDTTALLRLIGRENQLNGGDLSLISILDSQKHKFWTDALYKAVDENWLTAPELSQFIDAWSKSSNYFPFASVLVKGFAVDRKFSENLAIRYGFPAFAALLMKSILGSGELQEGTVYALAIKTRKAFWIDSDSIIAQERFDQALARIELIQKIGEVIYGKIPQNPGPSLYFKEEMGREFEKLFFPSRDQIFPSWDPKSYYSLWMKIRLNFITDRSREDQTRHSLTTLNQSTSIKNGSPENIEKNRIEIILEAEDRTKHDLIRGLCRKLQSTEIVKYRKNPKLNWNADTLELFDTALGSDGKIVGINELLGFPGCTVVRRTPGLLEFNEIEQVKGTLIIQGQHIKMSWDHILIAPGMDLEIDSNEFELSFVDLTPDQKWKKVKVPQTPEDHNGVAFPLVVALEDRAADVLRVLAMNYVFKHPRSPLELAKQIQLDQRFQLKNGLNGGSIKLKNEVENKNFLYFISLGGEPQKWDVDFLAGGKGVVYNYPLKEIPKIVGIERLTPEELDPALSHLRTIEIVDSQAKLNDYVQISFGQKVAWTSLLVYDVHLDLRIQETPHAQIQEACRILVGSPILNRNCIFQVAEHSLTSLQKTEDLVTGHNIFLDINELTREKFSLPDAYPVKLQPYSRHGAFGSCSPSLRCR